MQQLKAVLTVREKASILNYFCYRKRIPDYRTQRSDIITVGVISTGVRVFDRPSQRFCILLLRQENFYPSYLTRIHIHRKID